MKFTFKIQQYQTDAVDAVTNVFIGQPYQEGITYIRDVGVSDELASLGFEDNEDIGIKNARLQLSKEQLLLNIQKIQADSNIHQSVSLVAPLGNCSLDIEMETGTGKTYVYIKTMFELNKKYGWSKFIVVVPSIAIREGVKKSFEMTAEHFMECYGKKARFFVYSSSNLNQLDEFSKNSGLNVMIINTQAFAASFNEAKNIEGRSGDSAARIIYTKRDSFGSRRPIDVIASNNPILILDEPQKMGKEDSVTQKALLNFNPLFTLNYSATHAKQHNLVYVLDALDAYNKRLVKKIEVKGFEVKNLLGTDSYLYLENIIISPTAPPQARVEFEVSHNNGPKREFHKLNVGDNLFYLSNEMAQYKGYTISEIDPISGVVSFSNGEKLLKGDVHGDVSESDMRRVQIRETIISHFEKEQSLFHKGIKTLSLFFIDEVAKYRQYDEDGNELLGEYGKVFEQEYLSVMNEYRSLFDPEYTKYLDSVNVQDVHKGYFSIDKKGHVTNSSLRRGTDMSDDISAYDLILKNKERLLSFEEPTRFIFSHSALREGWDNPNVFQICTLKKSDSETQKRQEVGRGLRLCVNKDGNRMDSEVLGDRVQDLNVLTVIASESYVTFVDGLQKQTEAVLYERPRKASVDYFTGKIVKDADGNTIKLDAVQANMIYHYLVREGYIDYEDKITKKYREDVQAGNLVPISEPLKPYSTSIHSLVQSIYDESLVANMFEDGNKPKVLENPLNERFYKKEFQKLWNEINHKYVYKVNFDSNELIKKAIDKINTELNVSRMVYTVTSGIQKEALTSEAIHERTSFDNAKTKTELLKKENVSQVQYDLLGDIARGTVLTRRTVASILKGIDPTKFIMFQLNPEEFISKVIRLIKEQKATMIVEHITYDSTEETYDSSIFTETKHKFMEKAFKAEKAIQDYIFTDGTADESIEKRFAKGLEAATEVNIYAKLPKGFSIPTPVGNYTPDWAIVFYEGKVKHIYFIAETKGSLSSMDLRPIENAKIDCAKKLFEHLSNGDVKFEHVNSYEELSHRILK